MTEEEWLTTGNPYDLTHHKASRSERKRRLLSCAFARRVLFLIPGERYALAVGVAEGYADGTVQEEELRATRRALQRLWNKRQFLEAGNFAATAVLTTLSKEAVMTVHGWESAAAARAAMARPNWEAGHLQETRVLCSLARDVFGNPFRPAIIEPSWLTWNGATIPKLAETIYDERRFQDLPILADALEEAGCANADILDHCRRPGEHVRGCWVVDLMLGKA